MELFFLYFSKYLNFGFIIKTHNLKFLTGQKMKGKKKYKEVLLPYKDINGH